MDNKESFPYDVFISYSSSDREFAERMVKRIESEEYHSRRFRCFYAPWDVKPGENILLKIETAIADSRFIALVMSPDWVKSDWTKLERAIPAYEDPAGLKGRIIPILRRNCDIPPSIKILNWLDFTRENNFEREMRRLLSRLRDETLRGRDNLDKTSIGIDFTAEVPQKENLASNLFPVLQLPRFIHRASASVGSREEVFSTLGEGAILPPFAVREDERMVYSFSRLQNKQSRLGELFKENTTETLAVEKVIGTRRSPMLIELLNRSMTAHMRALGMTYDWNTKKTFFPLETDSESFRETTWRVGSREFTRKLVARSKSGSYYAHRSCKATFTELSGSLYLKIVPGWHFTEDGLSIPVSPGKMTSLSTRWMNIERNHTVLDNVRFWAYVLSKDSLKIVMNVGSEIPAEVSAVPLFGNIERGIESDYRERLWYEAEPEIDEADLEVKEEESEVELEGSVD